MTPPKLLSRFQRIVLGALDIHMRKSIYDVAREVDSNPSAVTKALRTLQEAGLAAEEATGWFRKQEIAP